MRKRQESWKSTPKAPLNPVPSQSMVTGHSKSALLPRLVPARVPILTTTKVLTASPAPASVVAPKYSYVEVMSSST